MKSKEKYCKLVAEGEEGHKQKIEPPKKRKKTKEKHSSREIPVDKELTMLPGRKEVDVGG